jgi:AraC family transcriptional regulator
VCHGIAQDHFRMNDHILGASIRVYAPDLRQDTHTHDTASVTLVLRGMLRETACLNEVTAASLSLVVKPAGVPHADIFGPEPVATCQIILNPEVHDSDRWREALSRWRWIVGGPGVRPALALATCLLAPDRDEEEQKESAAAVLDSLAGGGRRAATPAWLPMATDFLRDQIASGMQCIRVTDAAAAVGVHPVHLSRVFRGHFGCTVSTWVRRHRVQRVACSLATTNETLSTIATRCGFADHSHMNRSFIRETALLPSGFRGLVAGV